jgi:D-ribulokinase
VLRSFFTDEQLAALTSQIDLSAPPGLGYYPLPKVGERFPVNDPRLQPRLTPRPDSDAKFLHGYDIMLSIGDFSLDSIGVLLKTLLI